jgi:hypothetical protein
VSIFSRKANCVRRVAAPTFSETGGLVPGDLCRYPMVGGSATSRGRFRSELWESSVVSDDPEQISWNLRTRHANLLMIWSPRIRRLCRGGWSFG